MFEVAGSRTICLDGILEAEARNVSYIAFSRPITGHLCWSYGVSHICGHSDPQRLGLRGHPILGLSAALGGLKVAAQRQSDARLMGLRERAGIPILG